MPDVLILFDSLSNLHQLEQLCSERAVRFKSTAEITTALDWLRTIEFDALIAYPQLALEEQKRLAEELWRKNYLAAFVLMELGHEHDRAFQQARLFGAEVARGPLALDVVGKILSGLAPRSQQCNQKFSILVVEDLDSPRAIVCSYLESLGYPCVYGVPSAMEALALLCAEPARFACVLTDIRMPRVSGTELIRQIRSTPELQQLPIIVLTAHGTLDCLIDSLKAGASGFLAKPPKKADLLREMGRAQRIAARKLDPRFATPVEVESLKQLLEERGY